MIKRSFSFLLAVLLCFGIFRLSLGLDPSIDVIPALNELSKLEYDLTYLIYLSDDSGQSISATFFEVMYNKMIDHQYQGADLPDYDNFVNSNGLLSFLLTAFNYLSLGLEKIYFSLASVGTLISDSYANLKVIFKAIAILIT